MKADDRWPAPASESIIVAGSSGVAIVQSFEKLRVEARLESLCEKGCRHVWDDIDALERGEELTETRDLSGEERRWLLIELKQIMAVYQGRCTVD
jgi:hypothetical protein